MRLINADALGIGKCNPDVFDNKGYAEGWNAAVAVIEKVPTIDAEPVRHGRLINTRTDELYEQWGDCSLCGERNYADAKYCQWCGAKMDGGEANGN